MGLKAAELIAIIVESILYGFATLLLCITVWSLQRDLKPKDYPRFMLGIVALTALLSTLHLVADAVYSFQGFVVFRGATTFWLDNRRFTFKDSVYYVQTLLANGLLIYRAFILWRTYWLLVPSFFWLATAVIGGHTIVSIAQPAGYTSEGQIFLHEIQSWIVAFYTIAVCLNVSITSILAWRLWIIPTQVIKPFSFSSLTPLGLKLLLVSLDCGVLYSMALMSMFVTYLCHSYAAFFVLDLVGQIIPIATYIIFFRLSLRQFRQRSGGKVSTRLEFTHSGVLTDRSSSSSERVVDITAKPHRDRTVWTESKGLGLRDSDTRSVKTI
ncbi:hypothetical protein BDZ89DRAFT_555534 [Hymenopellis radicata]|nr:hypothetical protein BDZ89DRAFT_555534 [Hymenopellis radicata]